MEMLIWPMNDLSDCDLLSLLAGKLIGKSLSDFDDLRNTEVNDFRWRMKVFANQIAQARRVQL